MKNRINTKLSMVLSLAMIAALCIAPPVRAGKKPPHGGGSGGGLPYPTASTVRQFIAGINYANQAGGAITINLAPGAIFKLKSVHNTTDGGNGLPVIGSTKPVDLTIIGNGATIQRIAVETPFRLFNVASGSSLTLNQVTVKGGYFGSGAAVLNHGTLNVMNGSILSGNRGSSGGGIYNNLGTVTITSSILSDNGVSYYGAGIYNGGGTVTISNGTLSGNDARFGGGIYNSGGTVTVINGSTLSDNEAYHADYPWSGGSGGGIYNASGLVAISNSTLTDNIADLYFGRGGGIYNNGEVTVENNSSITGNTVTELGGADVFNVSVLYLDSSSAIGVLEGNPAISF